MWLMYRKVNRYLTWLLIKVVKTKKILDVCKDKETENMLLKFVSCLSKENGYVILDIESLYIYLSVVGKHTTRHSDYRICNIHVTGRRYWPSSPQSSSCSSSSVSVLLLLPRFFNFFLAAALLRASNKGKIYYPSFIIK